MATTQPSNQTSSRERTFPPRVQDLASVFETDEFINIIVDEDTEYEATYKMQRALLTNTSEYFEKALADNFREGETRTLRFPGTHPIIVQYFLYYLIRGITPLCDKYGTDSDRTRTSGNPNLAVHMWIFADQHLIPKLKNQAIGYLHFLAQK